MSDLSDCYFDWDRDDDQDDDLRREAIDERLARSRATQCQCGDDLPGQCPGPAFCPMCDGDEDE